VPTIATAWQGVAEAESRRAADAAEAAYAASFPQDVPADDAALESAHQAALLEAQRAFDAQALGDESVKKANEKRWRESCASRFREYREKKLATAELACERAINEASVRLADIVRREGATLDDLKNEATAFQERYSASKECSGPAKWRRLADFMRDVYGNAQRDMAARQAERQKVAAQQAQAAAASAQAAVQQASARATAAEGSVAALQERITHLESQLAQATAELTTTRAAAAASNAQLAQLSQSTQRRDSERASMAEQLRIAQESESQARAELVNLQQQTGALQQQIVAERTKAEGLQRQVQESGSGWASEKGRMEATIDSVTAARDAAQAARATAEAARTAAEQRVVALQNQLTAVQAQADEGAAIMSAKFAETSLAMERLMNSNSNMRELMEEARGLGAGPSAAAPSPPAAAPSPPAAVASSVPDPAKMNVAAMKEWLTENGHEAKVWEMSQAKAKKADWVAFISSLQ
jgi:predicted  nucleic acid-binding Zn-ribbon protein